MLWHISWDHKFILNIVGDLLSKFIVFVIQGWISPGKRVEDEQSEKFVDDLSGTKTFI